MDFTPEQKELMYAALMAYGNRLSSMLKEIPNETEYLTDLLAERAKESWELARKILG